jgi:ArsR family transcriptional regulator, arsenate/arsenite/antimonite-responsive transcriptional repressor
VEDRDADRMTGGARGRHESRASRRAPSGNVFMARGPLTTQFFRALADRTRLRLVNLLVRGTLCVCDLQRLLDEPQSTVSRHLGYLKAAGLITDRRDGVRIFYALTPNDHGLRLAVFEAIRAHIGRGVSQFAEEAADFRRDVERLEAMRAAGACHEEPRHAGASRHAEAGRA